ncbi:MAG: efflux RND transporter periplasmic adaptor subunit [Candidatus Aminicenantes bacterium]|jgi:multidrug efflux pump subunit AcrA (membrane-fusion protein)
MSKVLKIIAFVIIIAGLVFAGFKIFQKEKKNNEAEVIRAEDKDNQTGTKKETALPVKVISIKRGNLPLRLNISAAADVWEKADVRSEIAGTIRNIKVSVGDQVKKGQVLIQLDERERQLVVEQREAEKLGRYSEYLVKEDTGLIENNEITEAQKKELENLKQNYQQAVKDIEKGKIPRKKFEKISDDYQKALIFSGTIREEVRKAQEGLSSAIVALKQAELNLKRTAIKSPFQGIVAELQISKGETINAGQIVLRVVNLKSLYLKGYALESEIQHLRKGTNVRVRFDSFPETFYYGEIQSISPEVDEERKTITVYVKIDNKDNLFLPGMHANIDVEYKIFENVIKVPRDAVITRQDRYLVFTVKDIQGRTGIANWVYVEVGHQNDEEIEIKSGIQEGDLVVIEGHMTLAHQSKVKIEN